MPVVHWSASDFNTEGVLTGHGPSSKVSTTSLSRRKSSCLKCSKPNPGPPVVSISTTRAIPIALGFAQAALAGAGAGAGAACGAAAPLVAAVCDQATPDAHSETALAKINPAAIRIVFPLHCSRARPRLFAIVRAISAPDHNSLVVPAPPRQRLLSPVAGLSAESVNSRGNLRVRRPQALVQWRF